MFELKNDCKISDRQIMNYYFLLLSCEIVHTYNWMKDFPIYIHMNVKRGPFYKL